MFLDKLFIDAVLIVGAMVSILLILTGIQILKSAYKSDEEIRQFVGGLFSATHQGGILLCISDNMVLSERKRRIKNGVRCTCVGAGGILLLKIITDILTAQHIPF